MQRIEEALGNNCWILLWISKEKKEACRGLLCISLATFGKEIQLGYLWICICFRNIVPFLSTLDTCRHILKFAIPQWIKWNCGEYLNEPYPLLGKRFITWLHTYLFLIWLFLSWVCTCVCVCVCVCVYLSWILLDHSSVEGGSLFPIDIWLYSFHFGDFTGGFCSISRKCHMLNLFSFQIIKLKYKTTDPIWFAGELTAMESRCYKTDLLNCPPSQPLPLFTPIDFQLRVCIGKFLHLIV